MNPESWDHPNGLIRLRPISTQVKACAGFSHRSCFGQATVMEPTHKSLLCCLERDSPLRTLLEGTAEATGERFFEALVENLARALNTKCAWVTVYDEPSRKLKALAFWVDGQMVPHFEVAIDNTPCEAVIDHVRLVHYPDNILDLFPNSLVLKELGAVSYLGVPLRGLDGAVLGHLAVIDDRPMPGEPTGMAMFHIFAARAAAELQRMRAESLAKERDARLALLVSSVMDAIIELDENLNMVMLNPAAEAILGFQQGTGGERNFLTFLHDDSRRKILDLLVVLDNVPKNHRYVWVPGGLEILNATGKRLQAEATLSRFEIRHQMFNTLVLRDINDRLEAEHTIRILNEQTAYLKAEIKSLENFDELIGQSPPFMRVLQSVAQVAPTDATVLIQGETGTGKELIARAIHRSSRRADKPFIKINCAAFPAGLVESELFGHEVGAFTGADRQRKGRFELADGGTIFLDEISEMPLDVQVKLLRVLQEGQFERLGGATPLSVDVRVIAATNRHLNEEILVGRFRADLFYRIHVFPITIPPLRERRGDIPLLVRFLVSFLASRLGRRIHGIASATMEQLVNYHWPGNVRELKNVIERAIITCPDDRLVLPEPLDKQPPRTPATALEPQMDLSTLEVVERQYIIHVLQSVGWRISGPRGAARILDLKPSTLRYRIHKLNIHMPW
jgi:formate hydrogenlyase transcriptional activator